MNSARLRGNSGLIVVRLRPSVQFLSNEKVTPEIIRFILSTNNNYTLICVARRFLSFWSVSDPYEIRLQSVPKFKLSAAILINT